MSTQQISIPVLDHLVFAAPHLGDAVEWFAAETGVTPAPGGSHLGVGTANHLVGLGGTAYLEIIGPDPGQPEPDQPRPFGIDDLPAGRIVSWAIRPHDLDTTIAEARAAGYDPGEVRAMSRRTAAGDLLQWRLTAPRFDDGGGLVQFLIDWGSTAHPTSGALPQAPLLSWQASHPDPASVRPALAALRADLHIDVGDHIALTATVQAASGPVTF
jgi:hypothetical protein